MTHPEARGGVSVIIPAYNAHGTISDCVESALSGSAKPREIIVVDDCSSDDTAAIVEGIAARRPGIVRLIRVPVNAGPARARNLGAAAAEGEYLFFVDSDTAMLSDTLQNFLLRTKEADAVSGIYHPEPLSEGAVPRYKAYLLAYFFGRRGVFDHDVFIASSAGIRASVFRDLGGFDENLPWGMDVENEEFGNRIVLKYRLLMDPAVNVRHHFPGMIKLTRTYFRRVSLWMELFLRRGHFEKGGNATMGTGLSTAAAAASVVAVPLLWVHPILGVVPVSFLIWHIVGYAGYFVYVVRQRPSFVLTAFILNYWFSIVLAAGAAYGLLRVVTGMSRLPDPGVVN
jgi:glycosyltransferase involved in cell wall biosynthesis